MRWQKVYLLAAFHLSLYAVGIFNEPLLKPKHRSRFSGTFLPFTGFFPAPSFSFFRTKKNEANFFFGRVAANNQPVICVIQLRKIVENKQKRETERERVCVCVYEREWKRERERERERKRFRWSSSCVGDEPGACLAKFYGLVMNKVGPKTAW